VRDLQELTELGNRVMSMAGLEPQLGEILRTLCRMLGADKGLVATLDSDTNRLLTAASVGFSEAGRHAIESMAPSSGACGRAYLERRTVTIEDTEADPAFVEYRELARREGFRSVHSRPLVTLQGDVFGVLAVHFREPWRATARDEQLVNICGQMASVLAERHMLYSDAMQLSRQVEVALESSAVPFCLLQPMRDASGALVDLRWEYLNGAAERALSLDKGAVTGRSGRETFPTAWQEPGFIGQLERALETGKTVEFEIQVQSAPTRPWYRVIASPCEGGLVIWFSNITLRKEQEQQLRDADRRKDEFLATLAHELRNPLAPIRQAAVIARSPMAKPEQQRWSLEVIERQVAHMAVLLDDLLDVSRITRGKLELRRQPTDLRQVIDAALEATRPAFEMRGQQLHVQWPDDALWADVDAMRMSQVVCNLLTNASKYTAAGGTAWLEGRREGGDALVQLRDNGIGIPPDSLEAVFGMFTQLRGAGTQATVGLGIGLALARGVAQLHGATLTAASEGPGRGSTFTLRIPLCAAPHAPGPAPGPQENATRKQRVLVADDNRDAAESLAEVLRMEGHEVLLAFDGEAALAAWRAHRPGVSLLDIGMPGLSGNDVAAAIRASEGGGDAILVAITGWGQERDRAAARQAGFDFHFTKPVNPRDVLRVVGDPQAARAA
jgi:signal transduction histidine kinase/CheY-like chemotaxis protein